MGEILIRCSSIGKIMTEPKTQKDGPLSVGARTYIRELAAQDIFGVDFEVSSKPMEKGIECEPDAIALLNHVRGLSLVKNTERRKSEFLVGECDLYNAAGRRGHDLKCSWSLSTFPICEADCADKVYEYQCRGYMALWDADEWSVDYAMVNTPERLIGYEPITMHYVDHIPAHQRLTSWVVRRDLEIEARMIEKVKAARIYYAEVIAEFDRTHQPSEVRIFLPSSTGAIMTEEQKPAPYSPPPIFALIDSMLDPAPAKTVIAIDLEESKPFELPAPEEPATLALGALNKLLDADGGLKVTEAYLSRLGFPAKTNGAAKLYKPSDEFRIRQAIASDVWRG